MTKAITVALSVLSSVAMMMPASADEGSCVIVTAGPSEDIECSYTASGEGTFTAVMGNVWTVTVVRNEVEVELARGNAQSGPKQGGVATTAGETVTVRVNARGVPGIGRTVLGYLAVGEGR